MDLTGRRHYRRSNASGFPGDHATQLVDQPEQVEMILTFDDTAVSQTEQAARCDRISKSSRSLRTNGLIRFDVVHFQRRPIRKSGSRPNVVHRGSDSPYQCGPQVNPCARPAGRAHASARWEQDPGLLVAPNPRERVAVGVHLAAIQHDCQHADEHRGAAQAEREPRQHISQAQATQ
jgi:hypothetical protein